MYDLILRDIINDEVTRLSNAKMDAIISALKKMQTASTKNRTELARLEKKGKRIKKMKTFYEDNN
jgi:uncharacterized protein YkuJ